jgi:hypothetical protein
VKDDHKLNFGKKMTHGTPTLMEHEFKLSSVESEAYRSFSPMRIRRIMTKIHVYQSVSEWHILTELSSRVVKYTLKVRKSDFLAMDRASFPLKKLSSLFGFSFEILT